MILQTRSHPEIQDLSLNPKDQDQNHQVMFLRSLVQGTVGQRISGEDLDHEVGRGGGLTLGATLMLILDAKMSGADNPNPKPTENDPKLLCVLQENQGQQAEIAGDLDQIAIPGEDQDHPVGSIGTQDQAVELFEDLGHLSRVINGVDKKVDPQ